MNTCDKNISFAKLPYRNIFSEIAEKLDTSRQAVRQSYYRGNTDVVDMVNKEVDRINRIIIKNSKLAQEAYDNAINGIG